MLAIICLVIVSAVVLVAIAPMFFPQSSDLSNGDCPSGQASCLAELGFTITITSQSGAGILNMSMHNVANYPFANIAFVSISPSLAGLVSDMPFSYNGTAVSASNPLPVGSSSSGSYRFSSGALNGTTYTITATATMTNGQVITEKAAIVSDM